MDSLTTRNLGEDGFRWFIGSVESLDDPMKLGRVRVRIVGEHDDSIETGDLPLAQVMMPNTNPNLNGIGRSPTGMVVGTNVVGFFIDGSHKQVAMIIGSFHTNPGQQESDHGVSNLARGTNVLRKELVGPEPQSSYAAEYPYNDVITTQSGHVIEIDDTPENERLHVFHKSGSYIEINKDGRRVTKIVDEDLEIVVKDKTLYVEGDVEIVSNGGSITITSKSDINVKSENVSVESKTCKIVSETSSVQAEDVSVKGETVSVTGSSISLKSNGSMNISSSSKIDIGAPVVAIKGLVKV